MREDGRLAVDDVNSIVLKYLQPLPTNHPFNSQFVKGVGVYP